MKWYHSAPVFFLWCILCGLLGYFIRKLDIPNSVHFGVTIIGSAAITVYCVTDFKSKFPDCNSKIGVSILFAVFALAYAMTEIAL